MGDESQGFPTDQGDHGSDFDPTVTRRRPGAARLALGPGDKKDDVNDEPSDTYTESEPEKEIVSLDALSQEELQ